MTQHLGAPDKHLEIKDLEMYDRKLLESMKTKMNIQSKIKRCIHAYIHFSNNYQMHRWELKPPSRPVYIFIYLYIHTNMYTYIYIYI